MKRIGLLSLIFVPLLIVACSGSSDGDSETVGGTSNSPGSSTAGGAGSSQNQVSYGGQGNSGDTILNYTYLRHGKISKSRFTGIPTAHQKRRSLILKLMMRIDKYCVPVFRKFR